MKHAYLIMAHHQFEVLHFLLSTLDDPRNDIYIHFDKKVKDIPKLRLSFSRLYILNDRMDVRWGDISQIKTELMLLTEACNNENSAYSYFHILSGTHLPLCSQNELHHYFNSIGGVSVTAPMSTSEREVKLKIHRYNFLTRYFLMPEYPQVQALIQFCWKSIISIQRYLRIERNKGKEYVKSSNWISMSAAAVHYIVSRSKDILKEYQYSLCGDEFFVATTLSRSNVHKLLFSERYLKFDFIGVNAKKYSVKDLTELKESECLFARKFDADNLELIRQIVSFVKLKDETCISDTGTP